MNSLIEQSKKYGIFALLFCTLFWWTINNYEKREGEYMKHEVEYHKIITDSQQIMKDSQKQMAEQQKTLDGFKLILDVKLEAIQKSLSQLQKGG